MSKLRIAVALVAAALVGGAGFALGRARAPQVVAQTKTVDKHLEAEERAAYETQLLALRTQLAEWTKDKTTAAVTTRKWARKVTPPAAPGEPPGCEETGEETRDERSGEKSTSKVATSEATAAGTKGSVDARAEERTRTQAAVVRGSEPRDRWGIWARARSPLLSVSPSFDSAGAAVRVVGPLWLGAGWQVGNKLLLEGRVTW